MSPVSSSIPPRLRALLPLLLCLVFLGVARSQTVETRDGRKFYGCRSFRLEGDALGFVHSAGRSRVPTDSVVRMPDEARQLLGLAEEAKVMRVVGRAEATTRFLALHDAYRAALGSAAGEEQSRPELLRFTVLEQIDPRALGLASLDPGVEVYRVRIGGPGETGPDALIETRGEKVFTTSGQELPVRYVRKISIQRVGLPWSIMPLFREAVDDFPAQAEARRARVDTLRKELEELGRKLHPGVACPSCKAGICPACGGTRNRTCPTCQGSRTTGAARTVLADCKACQGRGTFARINGPPTPCRTCAGAGKVVTGTLRDPCPACDGIGVTACPLCKARGFCATCAGKGVLPATALTDEQLAELRNTLAPPEPAPVPAAPPP